MSTRRDRVVGYAAFFGDVLKNAPQVGAITAAFLTKLFKCEEKALTITWIDAIFGRDEPRAAIIFDLMSKHPCWPMHRGVKVDRRADLELPVPLGNRSMASIN